MEFLLPYLEISTFKESLIENQVTILIKIFFKFSTRHVASELQMIIVQFIFLGHFLNNNMQRPSFST